MAQKIYTSLHKPPYYNDIPNSILFGYDELGSFHLEGRLIKVCAKYHIVEFWEEVDDTNFTMFDIPLNQYPDLYEAIIYRQPLTKAQELELTLLDRAAFKLVKTWLNSNQ